MKLLASVARRLKPDGRMLIGRRTEDCRQPGRHEALERRRNRAQIVHPVPVVQPMIPFDLQPPRSCHAGPPPQVRHGHARSAQDRSTKVSDSVRTHLRCRDRLKSSPRRPTSHEQAQAASRTDHDAALRSIRTSASQEVFVVPPELRTSVRFILNIWNTDLI